MGLIFSNQASYINRVLFDLVLDCIYETNIKDYENENLRELISINDLPILAWALAYSIFPNGYSRQLVRVSRILKNVNMSLSQPLTLTKLCGLTAQH